MSNRDKILLHRVFGNENQTVTPSVIIWIYHSKNENAINSIKTITERASFLNKEYPAPKQLGNKWILI